MTDIITTPRRFVDKFGLADAKLFAVIHASAAQRSSLLSHCTRMKKRVPGWNYKSYKQPDGSVAIRVVSTGDQERNKS